MLRKNPLKKVYNFNDVFNNESHYQIKNNLLLNNLESNYEFYKQIKLKNKFDNNLTEIKEFNNKNKLLLSKPRLSTNKNQNYNSNKNRYGNILKYNSQIKLIKSKVKIDNILTKNITNNKTIPNKKYINNNTSFNSLFIKKNKTKKNLFNQRYIGNKNFIEKIYRPLPILKGSKSKKYSLSLFEKEKQKQRDNYNKKLKQKLLELEECEKKFDIEIFNTLSKLNEEGQKLYKFN